MNLMERCVSWNPGYFKLRDVKVLKVLDVVVDKGPEWNHRRMDLSKILCKSLRMNLMEIQNGIIRVDITEIQMLVVLQMIILKLVYLGLK